MGSNPISGSNKQKEYMVAYKSSETKEKAAKALLKGSATSANIRHNIREEREREYYAKPKTCQNCSKVISYESRENKYCSSSCSAKISNRKRKQMAMCPICMRDFSKKRADQIYCSISCANNSRNNGIVKLIESNEIVGNSALRSYLMHRWNEKCQRCGWGIRNETSGSVCLDMHHIDGNSENTKLSNVELLCPNCHSLTPNYKRVSRTHASNRQR